MKKLSIILLVLIATLFTGCFDTEEKKVEEKQTIRIGTSGGYYPFTFFEKDKLQGFEIDVWNAIAEKLDVNVEFKTAKFSGLFGMLETNKIDTISNQITMTQKRLEKYDFAQAYVFDGAQLVVHQDRNDISSLEDLKGKKVGVSLGTNYVNIVKEFDTENQIEVISYDGNGFEQDVVLKRIDAFVQDRVSSVELIKKANLPLKLVGSPIVVIKNSFPFVRNEKNKILINQVNSALSSLREDGTLNSISMKWFNTDITKK